MAASTSYSWPTGAPAKDRSWDAGAGDGPDEVEIEGGPGSANLTSIRKQNRSCDVMVLAGMSVWWGRLSRRSGGVHATHDRNADRSCH